MLTRSVSVVLLALAVGCAGTHPDLLGPDSIPLERLDAAPYRIAIAPVEMKPGSENASEFATHARGSSETMKFRYADATRFQQKIVACLRKLNSASQVTAIGKEELLDEKLYERFDLIVKPKLETEWPRFAHDGLSGNWWASGLLWLGTWIGGLGMPDSTYSAALRVGFSVENWDQSRPFTTVNASTKTADLTFWDRNDGLSFGLLQSIILPPFFTSDEVDTTSESLSDQLCLRLAGQLAREFKTGLNETEARQLGKLLLESPRNLAENVGPSIRLQGELQAEDRIVIGQVRVNGKDAGENREPETGKSPPNRGRMFSQRFDYEINGLAPGKNVITLYLTVGRLDSTKSIVVWNGARANARGGDNVTSASTPSEPR